MGGPLRSGRYSKSSLEWLVIDAKGKEYQVFGLRNWCKENNLKYNMVFHNREGWKSLKIGDKHGYTYGRNMTEDNKKSISLAKSGRSNGHEGMIQTQETKDRIGKANSIALKGNIPWNKNLTKEDDIRLVKAAEKQKITKANKNNDII